jgi:protein-disulfide isomerase
LRREQSLGRYWVLPSDEENSGNSHAYLGDGEKDRAMSSEDTPKLTVPVNEARDHVQGSPAAKVTLVEYGDYQCPYCGEAYSIIKKIQKRFGPDLRFVFRNFPITEVHPFAENGAEIAEAAGAQGKFWEMHDYLYENQQSLSNVDFFAKYASEKLELDGKRLKQEVATRKYTPRIQEDFMSGVRSGVNGTPTFFINDYRHNGSYEYDVMEDAIEIAIGSKKRDAKKPMASHAVKQTRR